MKKKYNIENPQTEEDFDLFIKDMFAEYGNIFFSEFNGEIYIYKALNRKEYKTIISNPSLHQIEKEDEVCKICMLWPKNLDFDKCEAGLPSFLYEEILKNSCLTGIQDMIDLIEIGRYEVDSLESQMTCIISEAFPNYSVDEIENWNMIQFCSIYCKAEWKLKNLKNITFNFDMLDFLRGIEETNEQEVEIQESSNEIKENDSNNTNNVKVGNMNMSPQEYKEYLEFKSKFPEINWEKDTMYTGFNTMESSTVATPLRIK